MTSPRPGRTRMDAAVNANRGDFSPDGRMGGTNNLHAEVDIEVSGSAHERADVVEVTELLEAAVVAVIGAYEIEDGDNDA